MWRDDVRAFAEAWGYPRQPGTRQLAAMLARHPGLRAVLVFRMSSWCHAHRVPFLPTLLAQLNTTFHGVEISPSLVAGPGLHVPHPFGTVIFADSLGEGVTVQGCVTIGTRGTEAKPVLGNAVFVGAGARVIGALQIGAGAKIGANAVVLNDVPCDATAVGVPARMLGQ
jgi:serine O-acetyltransferase